MGTRGLSWDPSSGDPPAGQGATLTEEQLKDVADLARGLAPTEAEIERRKYELSVLYTADMFRAAGGDPVAFLASAFSEKVREARKRKKGRPRLIEAEGLGALYELLDEAWRQAFHDLVKATSERRVISVREADLFFAERLTTHAREKGVPSAVPEVGAVLRWLALEHERKTRKRNGDRMPGKNEWISVPGGESGTVAAIEDYVRRHAGWLRKK